MSRRGQHCAMTWRTCWFVLLVALLLAPATVLTTPASAATPVAAPVSAAKTFTAETTATVDFPVGLNLTATLHVPDAGSMVEVDLLYQAGDDETERLIFVPTSAIRHIDDTTLAIDATVNLQQAAVPPGVTISFRWRVMHNDQSQLFSQDETTTWYDTRQQWSEVQSDQVDLHYFGLDAGFAGRILDSAQQTVTELETTYKLERSRTLAIWVYPDQASFRGSLPPNSRDTIAGGSFIGYSLITAVIPDGSDREIGRVIPHEVSHQVLFQATRNPFTILPVWFDEGMATHIQTGGTSTYMGMVVNAAANGALFDLQSLAASFPYTPSQATLAYAASWSAIEYIRTTYGEDGLAALIAAFGTGVPYDQVVQDALGISMAQLNHDWKTWVMTRIPS